MRPKLSRDFVLDRRRERIVGGTARSISARGYHATTVTDIVRETGIGRNTFYDCFGSKEDAALAMLAAVCPVFDTAGRSVDRDGIVLLAVDIAARVAAGDQIGAALIADAEQQLARPVTVEPLEGTDHADDPTLSKLPPGRHGLDHEFVRENQRRRLIAGTAHALHEVGCQKASIADITRHAAVSRRTFYEHFTGKLDAVRALVEEDAPTPLDLDSGLGCLWAQIVASAVAGDQMGSENRRRGGLSVVRMLTASLEVAEAA